MKAKQIEIKVTTDEGIILSSSWVNPEFRTGQPKGFKKMVDNPREFFSNFIDQFFPKRKLDDKERDKGRSEGYWDMSPEDQWAEDKRLGILDWDGN